MLLGTLAVAILAVFFGYIAASSTGFFGVSRTMEERIPGFITIAMAVVMIFFSFSLFRRKNLVPFLIIVGTVIARYLAMGRYVSQNVENVVFLYILGMSVCFLLDSLIAKKLGGNNTPKISSKERKFNKLLVIIPTVLLALGWLYLNYGQYWIEESQIAASQKETLCNLKYQLFAVKYLPSGYKLRETRIGGYGGKYFYYAEYRNEQQDGFLVSQYLKPAGIRLQPPNCAISDDGRSGFELIDGSGMASSVNSPCEAVTTPAGRRVYIMAYHLASEKNYAAAVYGGTLVTVSGYSLPQPELAKIFDSLEPAPASKIPVKSPQIKY